MKPGTHTLPEVTQGDTFLGRAIATLRIGADPIAITSGTMELRSNDKAILIHRWTTEGASPNAAIQGEGDNSFVIHPVAEETTATWPVGTHAYGIKLVTTYGNLTFLAGQLIVAPAPVKPTA